MPICRRTCRSGRASAARGCVLVVDESHSLGTHGPNGEGLVVELGLENRVHFRTASLAKAFAARAGFIACAAHFAEYFKFESLPAIFSSTLLPHEVAGLAATLEVIRTEGWRREKLRANSVYLRDALEERGIFGSVFCAPATPKNRSMVRLSLHCALKQHELDRVLDACRDIRSKTGFDQWPSTRRRRNEERTGSAIAESAHA